MGWRSTWTYLFQDSRSQIATAITNFHSDVMVIMLFVVGFVLWILTRTRILRMKAQRTYRITHGRRIEIIWTLLPRLAVSSIALPSWTLLYSTDRIPGERTNPFDLTIKVTGRQWYWCYEYGLDLREDVERPSFESYMTRDLVTRGDVIHSWAVPSLGVKCDAIPGRLNQVFFLRNREGVFTGQCSELCGA